MINTCTCEPGTFDPQCPFTLRVLKAVKAYAVPDPCPPAPLIALSGPVGSDGGPEPTDTTSGPSTSSEVKES